MTSRKRAVFVGAGNSVFVSRTRDTLCEKGVAVVVIDPYSDESNSASAGTLAKIWQMFRRFQKAHRDIKNQSPDQTAVLHYLSVDSFWLIPLLSSHFDRVVAVAYGSDVLRRVKSRDWLLRAGLIFLDGIAATNTNVMETLLAEFPFITQKERRILKFGLPVFDALDSLRGTSIEDAKKRLGFDANLCLVSLGYSASSGQRQKELIAFFAENSDVFADLQFVVPVQYGASDVRNEVQVACAAANARLGRRQFHALTEFYDTETSALLRKGTDVLINHSISDAFSGTVQEAVYAGNLVLAADHLPYKAMPGFGSAIKLYQSFGDVAHSLTAANLREWRLQAKNSEPLNREQLRRISSWDAVFPDWLAFINGVEL